MAVDARVDVGRPCPPPTAGSRDYGYGLGYGYHWQEGRLVPRTAPVGTAWVSDRFGAKLVRTAPKAGPE